MSAWMVYATLVGALLCAGAWILERAANAHRAPLRGIWALALVASCAIPGFAWLTRAPVQETASAADDLFQRSDVVLVSTVPVEQGTQEWSFAVLAGQLRYLLTTPPSIPRHWDPIVATLWGLLSLCVAVMLVWSFANLRRAKRRWTTESLDGREVLVSDEVGPAVVGVLRPSIVLPRWALSLPDQDRELVLRHEEEHRRAGDPHLIFASIVLLALVPWNAALWWQVRRLRMAVELDCDRRVVGRGKVLRRYASLLVEMGRRGTVSRLSALALAQPTPFLERRIRTMTTRKRPHYTLTVAAALVASLFAMTAYQVEAPATLADVLISYADATGAPLVTSNIAMPQAPGGVTVATAPAQVTGIASVAAPVTHHAQAVGRITGRALDRQTAAPIQFVQIYISTLRLGSLSRANGEFVIENVPAGTYEIRAERVGLTTITHSITVEDGATVEVSFPMSSQALGMAEILSNSPFRSDSESAPSASPAAAQAAQVPPAQRAGVNPETPSFTPHTVRPQLLNGSDVQAALASKYPPMLRDAGVRGTTMVFLFIDANGVVENVKVQTSSEHAAMDQAALEVALLMRFSPALNRDQAVPVWVAIPLTFRP